MDVLTVGGSIILRSFAAGVISPLRLPSGKNELENKQVLVLKLK